MIGMQPIWMYSGSFSKSSGSMKMPPCLASSICSMRAFCIGMYLPSVATTPVGTSSSDAIE